MIRTFQPGKMVRIWLPILLLLHVCLAAWYAQSTPYREGGRLAMQRTDPSNLPKDIGAPDERQHANYIKRLADGKGFPVLGDPAEDPYENYQAHQPPLFYVLGLGWAKAIGPDSLVEPGSGLKVRFLNVLIGTGTVAGVFFLALWGTRREDVALGAAAFAAFLPMHVALNGALSNDPLLYCLCAWTLAHMVRAATEGWTLRAGLLVGAMIGMAALTKTTAVALYPALLVALWPSLKGETKALTLKAGIAALTLSLLIPVGWWLRNMQLYGDPLAIKAFNQAFTGSPQASMFITELGAMTYWTQWVGWWTFRSFVGVFGYMDIFLPDTLYRLAVAVLFLVMAIGGLKAKETTQGQGARACLWVFAAVVTLLFVRFNTQYFQGQARYLFPALGAFALLFGLGLAAVGQKRSLIAVGVASATMLGLTIWAGLQLPGAFELRVVPGASQRMP